MEQFQRKIWKDWLIACGRQEEKMNKGNWLAQAARGMKLFSEIKNGVGGIHRYVLDIQWFVIMHNSYILQSHREHWISEYWTLAPRGNTELASSELLITIFLSTDQYMTYASV